MSLIVPSRRRFLLGAGALVASAAIVKAANLMPISSLFVPPKLWGDGVHDDTAALQWLADNAKPYEHAVPPGGTYLISKTLTYKGKSGLIIQNCTFIAKQPLDCALYFGDCRDGMITHVTFKNANWIIGGLAFPPPYELTFQPEFLSAFRPDLVRPPERVMDVRLNERSYLPPPTTRSLGDASALGSDLTHLRS